MGETKLSAILLRLLKRICITELVIVVVVCLICWLTRHLTFFYIGNGLVYAGAGAILLGILSVAGGWSAARSFKIQYGQSAGDMDISQRTRRLVADLEGMYGSVVWMFVVGILTIILGVTLHSMAGII
jgi:hypothetical protein